MPPDNDWVDKGVSIITTTWNEKDNIPKLIPRIRDALGDIRHEIIVVDDSSPDGTYIVAKELADVAVKKRREGQSEGLAYGMSLAKYSYLVTLDADLENDPRLIRILVNNLKKHDLVVASREKLPRISEKLASLTFGRVFGIRDVFSNFRAYRKDVVCGIKLKLGETYGAEFLANAKKRGYQIGEVTYSPMFRRKSPRIGGIKTANLKIMLVLIKLLLGYTVVAR